VSVLCAEVIGVTTVGSFSHLIMEKLLIITGLNLFSGCLSVGGVA